MAMTDSMTQEGRQRGEGDLSIEGRGTVVTGRIERGLVKVNEPVEIVGIAWFNLLLPVQSELEQNFKSTGYVARIIGYRSPEMDRLLDQAILTRDRTRQKAVYEQIQQLVAQDVPRILTIRPDVIWGVRKTVTLPAGIGSLRGFFGSVPGWTAR